MCLCQNPRIIAFYKSRNGNCVIPIPAFAYGLINYRKKGCPESHLSRLSGQPFMCKSRYGYKPLRPVTKLITRMIAAIINRMCIRPPATSIKNPISHTTITTARIIQRIRAMFFTQPFCNNYFDYSNTYPGDN